LPRSTSAARLWRARRGIRNVAYAAALATALTVCAAFAQQQQQQAQRLDGTIERVDGNTIHAKRRDGGAITLKLADNVTVTAVLKATVADSSRAPTST
jgi:hypothetical protein